MNCPHCGNEIQDEKAVYCPYCSKPLRIISRKKTGFPIAAGILTILAACIFVPVGVLFMGAYVWYSIQLFREGIEVFITGFFSILGFALGLTSGIMSQEKVFCIDTSRTDCSHIFWNSRYFWDGYERL